MRTPRRALFRQDRFRQRSNANRRKLSCQQLEDRRMLATLMVTNDGDAGIGSLRQAVLDANATPAVDVIEFDPSLNESIIFLLSGQLHITEPLTVDASNLPGSVTIDASYSSRAFEIDDGTANPIDVDFNKLTITSGYSIGDGGGIHNSENLTLTGCMIRNNTTQSGFVGGGIFSDGTLTIRESTISHNTSSAGGGVHQRSGDLELSGSTIYSNLSLTDAGGIWSENQGYRTTITNSTISQNFATYDGGALLNASGLTIIANSTITENYAGLGLGSGVASSANTNTSTTVVSSIISGNGNNRDVDYISPYLNNAFSSYGYNLIGGGNALANFGGTDQTLEYNPGLLPLSHNGGPTLTHAPLVTSPAIDAGLNPRGLMYDQRGAPFFRQEPGFVTDVGAVEWQTALSPLIVDIASDELDDDYSPGDLSLREAINWANGLVGFNPITFDTAGAFAGTTTIDLTLGNLHVTSSLAIEGPAANRLKLDAHGRSRVFDIFQYPTAGPVTLRGMTITGGFVGGNGGVGGGINSDSTELTVVDCVVSGNSAAQGGGIYSGLGQLSLISSTVSDNFATYFGGGISSNSGLVGSPTTILNSTISSNWSSSIGGGFFNTRGLTVIMNSTITGNSAVSGQGSGVASIANTYTLTEVVSSIISGNAHASDVDLIGTGGIPSFVSGGHNVIGDGTAVGVFTNNDQRYVVDPMLTPLGEHGGPTLTHVPTLASPAIDTGINPLGLMYDQRGAPFLRQDFGFPVDVGAVEWQTASFPLVVDTNLDELDDDFGPGDLSLREAINAANGFSGPDFITFDTAGAFAGPQIIDLVTGQLKITDSVAIEGPRADQIVIDAQQASRVFYIDDGQFGADTHVALSGMTITGGRVASGYDDGGGILNREQLTLTATTVRGNSAVGSYADGGAIYSSTAGFVTVASSTISGNSATFRGGGIFSNAYSGGVVLVENSTVSGNAAGVHGGGMFNRTGTMDLESSTVTDNTAQSGYGSGIASLADVYTATILSSTIVSGNEFDSDVEFVDGSTNTFASGGYNLIGNGNALGVFLDTDQTQVTDPGLAPLADNGGHTLTHAVLFGSPAVDGGNPNFIATYAFDQRGAPFARMFNGRLDVGAFERIDGDFNNDGSYTCVDVDALVAEIASGTNDATYDLNSDLLVDEDDLATWLAVAGAANLPSHNSYLLGDANLDGFVDGQDFLVWNTHKFTAVAAWCAGDFNADGLVDGLDFLTWNANKFQSSFDVPVAQHEPTATQQLMLKDIIWDPSLARKVDLTAELPAKASPILAHFERDHAFATMNDFSWVPSFALQVDWTDELPAEGSPTLAHFERDRAFATSWRPKDRFLPAGHCEMLPSSSIAESSSVSLPWRFPFGGIDGDTTSVL